MDIGAEESPVAGLSGTLKPCFFEQPQPSLRKSQQVKFTDDAELEGREARRRNREGDPQLHQKCYKQLDRITRDD